MKVMVLGGAGYVGSMLCKKLINKKIDTVVVDRGFFGFCGLEEIENEIKLIKKDGFDIDEKDLEGVTHLINISGFSNDPMADFNSALNFKLNTELTGYTAKLCKKMGIKYIFASSCSIYDFGFNDEKRDVLVDETATVNPTKFYSLSKYEAEKILLNMVDETFKPIILRKATICGYSPKMRYDLVVNTFFKDAMKNKELNLNGGGENWRPLIDVNDMCEIYIRCLDLDDSGIFNAVGYNIRISELALRVLTELKRMGHKVEINCNYSTPKSQIRNYRVDGSKLHQKLNFVPQITVEDSLRGLFGNISKISDFSNPIYYNIDWTKKFLQHWLAYNNESV